VTWRTILISSESEDRGRAEGGWAWAGALVAETNRVVAAPMTKSEDGIARI